SPDLSCRRPCWLCSKLLSNAGESELGPAIGSSTLSEQNRGLPKSRARRAECGARPGSIQPSSEAFHRPNSPPPAKIRPSVFGLRAKPRFQPAAALGEGLDPLLPGAENSCIRAHRRAAPESAGERGHPQHLCHPSGGGRQEKRSGGADSP